ncbi:MAG: NBR1-Ig-like domain-containing protein [Anaerolineales bacterium]
MKLVSRTITVLLLLALMLSSMPGATSSASAATCYWAQFIADVTIPDGTNFAPGTAFTKTWRLKNIGGCVWNSGDVSLIFVSGQQMGAPTSVALPITVNPGQTVDISVNMTAPSAAGHYLGYYKFKSASGGEFGIGSAANSSFWVEIYVASSSGTGYDFTANAASATWSSGAGTLAFPGTDGSSNGFSLRKDNPILENGIASAQAGLLFAPNNITNGYIQAVYPAFYVQSGDRFQTTIGCEYGSTTCYVAYRLDYQIGSGSVKTFWTFHEKYEGLSYNANLDLSSLAGQNVKFILVISAYGSPTGDRALWVNPIISRPGGTPPPVTPTTATPIPYTCDRAQFIADVTVPDGTIFAPGYTFNKTWRLKNIGTCTWTNYSLIFDSGEKMSGPDSALIPTSVAPGQTVDITIPLTSPTTAGTYRGYWKLKNSVGVPFGIGSGGTKSFWVEIYVSSSSTSVTTINADTPDPSVPSQSVLVSVSVSGSGATPTGTVAITGADTNCTITLASGSGSCNIVFTTVGSKTLTATYSGNGSYSGSSSTTSHTVSLASGVSVTTINSDTPDPSTPSQNVAVNVTVSGSGATPTGTVAITGADTNCTITLASGSGSCNVVFTTVGSKTLTATYSGDGSYSGSSSTTSHTVSLASGASVTTINSDTPDPSTPSQNVAVSVTVSGSGVTPTGTVAITGADTNCTITLASGSGSCNVVFNTVGSKTLTATYSGDGSYSGSSSTTAHTVKYPATTVITYEGPDPSTTSENVTVNVTVSGAGATPTGTVGITGADINCTITLAGGSGSCDVVFNTPGAKGITATYNGDANYVSGSMDTKGHTVLTPPSGYNYDFGTGSSPLEPAYTRITHTSGYSSGLAGWTDTIGLESRDRGAPDKLNRDFVQHSSAARTFKVDLANGVWYISVTMGDNNHLHDDMIVKANGITQLTNVDSAAGVFTVSTFNVTVSGGSLSIEFSDGGGSDPTWIVNRLNISSTP